jgi:hypothetical protein
LLRGGVELFIPLQERLLRSLSLHVDRLNLLLPEIHIRSALFNLIDDLLPWKDLYYNYMGYLVDDGKERAQLCLMTRHRLQCNDQLVSLLYCQHCELVDFIAVAAFT